MILMMAVGIVLIFVGFLMLILPLSSEKSGTSDLLKDMDREARGKNLRGGAVVMIGPIPILVGSDPMIALLVMLIVLITMLVWLIGFRLG